MLSNFHLRRHLHFDESFHKHCLFGHINNKWWQAIANTVDHPMLPTAIYSLREEIMKMSHKSFMQ